MPVGTQEGQAVEEAVAPPVLQMVICVLYRGPLTDRSLRITRLRAASVDRDRGRLQHTSLFVGMPGTRCAPISRRRVKPLLPRSKPPKAQNPLTPSGRNELRPNRSWRGESVRRVSGRAVCPGRKITGGRRAALVGQWRASGATDPGVESLWPLHGDKRARGEVAGACADRPDARPSWRPPTSLIAVRWWKERRCCSDRDHPGDGSPPRSVRARTRRPPRVGLDGGDLRGRRALSAGLSGRSRPSAPASEAGGGCDAVRRGGLGGGRACRLPAGCGRGGACVG